MSILFPNIRLKSLPALFGMALIGAAAAGLYGALHDQISYTISPEYFTKLKFLQFAHADFGWPPRMFAAEVGFLATWWVGLIGGWLVARAGIVDLPGSLQWWCFGKAFLIALTVAALVGLIGALVGLAVAHGSDLGGWRRFQEVLDLEDLPAFVIVAYLHWASYLGGVLGLILAIVYVRNQVRYQLYATEKKQN